MRYIRHAFSASASVAWVTSACGTNTGGASQTTEQTEATETTTIYELEP
jgi:hypothetical protein